jgi:hypothetical protein
VFFTFFWPVLREATGKLYQTGSVGQQVSDFFPNYFLGRFQTPSTRKERERENSRIERLRKSFSSKSFILKSLAEVTAPQGVVKCKAAITL